MNVWMHDAWHGKGCHWVKQWCSTFALMTAGLAILQILQNFIYTHFKFTPLGYFMYFSKSFKTFEIPMCAHRHVCSTSSAASLGLRIHKSATNAKITQFDLPFVIQQDIRWLHVSVNDTVFLFQIKQSLHNLHTNRKSARWKRIREFQLANRPVSNQ